MGKEKNIVWLADTWFTQIWVRMRVVREIREGCPGLPCAACASDSVLSPSRLTCMWHFVPRYGCALSKRWVFTLRQPERTGGASEGPLSGFICPCFTSFSEEMLAHPIIPSVEEQGVSNAQSSHGQFWWADRREKVRAAAERSRKDMSNPRKQ